MSRTGTLPRAANQSEHHAIQTSPLSASAPAGSRVPGGLSALRGHHEFLTIRRAYKTELDPTPRQAAMFARCCGGVRWAYNRGLEFRKRAWEEEQKTVRAFTLNRELTKWKQENDWLYDIPNASLGEAFRDLEAAFRNFFRRVKSGNGKPGYPRFKARGRDPGRFTLRGTIRVSARGIELPWTRRESMGSVRLKERGYLPVGIFPYAGEASFVNGRRILSATISERAGRWFVSLQVEERVQAPAPVRGPAVAVDLGVGEGNLLACNSLEGGERRSFDNPRALRSMERRLRKLQKEFARRHCALTIAGEAGFRANSPGKAGARNIKHKGQPLSANARKTKQKIQRLHYRIACVRRDAAHQATHRIIAHAKPRAVVVEDLNVAGMMQNKHIAKSVADAGIAEAKRQLSYKAGWNGTEVVEADRWFASTKTCPACGHKNDFGLSQRRPICTECGYTGDRDLDWAALNLAALAGKPPESINACGEGGSGHVAQAAG